MGAALMLRWRSRASVLVVVLVASGCANNNSLYEWGQYEAVVYSSYAAPGKVPPEEQLSLLEKDIDKAGAEGKRVAPGVRAYRGFLLFQLGRLDEARTKLLAEKSAFPESAVFVDRLLLNMAKAP